MDELFPLPVTPFEYYYLCDDRADYPTTFFIELTLSGKLARGAMKGALARIVSRHPLLSARIDMNRGGRPNWIAGEGPQLDWGDEDQPLLGACELPIDLTRSAGLRVWVRAGQRASRIIFQVHHACCDGLAGLRFVEELLLAYHALASAEEPQLPPLDPLLLSRRDERERPSLVEHWNIATFWLRTLVASPAPIAAPRAADAADAPANDFPYVPGMRLATLASEQMRSLRVAASRRKATLNDLLLRDLFLVLAKWNTEHGTSGASLRINVPTSLRESLDRKMPAANALGFAFLTRAVCERTDSGELLASIRREMEQIKRQNAGRYFLDGLAFACRFRGLVPWALARPHCFATAVLSNLGRIYVRTPLPRQGRKLVCGKAVLERVAGVPPIRPQTRAAIAVIQYADETTISLHTDVRCLPPPAADELLARYAARLSRSSGDIGEDQTELSSAVAARVAADD